MKKLISLMLALIMVLSLATVVSAADTEYAEFAGKTYTFPDVKTFTMPEGADNWSVDGTVTFNVVSVTLDGEAYSADGFSVADATVGDDNKADIVLTVPALSSVGEYKVTIKEASNNIAGAAVNTSAIEVRILVTYDNKNNTLVVENGNYNIAVRDETGNKQNELNNNMTFGSVKVKKVVTGNMASKNDKFWLKVTLTAGEGKQIGTPIVAPVNADSSNPNVYYIEASESSGEFTFSQIPTGVTVNVVEVTAKNGDQVDVDGKIGNYTLVSIDKDKTIVEGDNGTITVTNNYETEVTTGIVTDSAPYIILIAVCAVAAVAFVLKRRNAVEF